MDQIEPLAAKHAQAWAAWGHRKIWALLRADGVVASAASVRRAIARRGLLHPGRRPGRTPPARPGSTGGVRRPAATACGSTTCCEPESLAGGIWRLGGVVEDWAKTCLAGPVTTTQTSGDAIGAVQAAIGQAELLLGCSLPEDCTDVATGELVPLVIVTDNAPADRSAGFAQFIASRPELAHVRTRHRSPGDQRGHRAVRPGDQVRGPGPARHR